MIEGRVRSAWIASLAIHGVLVATVAWWLAGYSVVPASVPTMPVPLRLAMFQPPAPIEPSVPAKLPPVQKVSPSEAVPEPVSVALPVQPPALTKPVPARPRRVKAAPPKPVAPAVEPVPAQPVESTLVAESPAAMQSPSPAPIGPSKTMQLARPVFDPALEDSYRVRVRQAVDEHKHYPRMARRLGLEGRVVVAFTVEADGRLAAVRVVESSGSELLDEAALEAVRQAAPFPPFPDGVERLRWDFILPLSFLLDL